VPEFVYDHDCTVLFTTNTFLGQYAKSAHPYDFYSLKHLVVGAEKLTEDVRRICYDKFGLRVLEGYGATECSPVISVNTPLAARTGTVGEILPGLDYRVVPVAGLNGAGVLHVRGDNVMLGYLKHDKPGIIQPVASELGPGWYDTGDVVTVSQEFVSIEARLKRFAKIAGEMVSLELVERVAAEARPQSVHAATVYRDANRGEAIVLFTEDATLDREKLRETARRAGVAELALPRRVVHLPEIPLLGNGKRDYVTLSRMAAELTDRAGSYA
jgi:acyl-[acyl-carrier-protein]-phospholipid O-acyltransferase/long-chain-fatty-acid--[acyl-carrier-protein] ligase